MRSEDSEVIVNAVFQAWPPRSIASLSWLGSDDGANISGIDKVTFPAETKTTLSATLTTGRLQLAGMANSSIAGYFGGGSDGANISGIDKVTFPADTKTTLSATLSTARASLASMANSGTAGYFGGGYDSAAFTACKVSCSATVRHACKDVYCIT